MHTAIPTTRGSWSQATSLTILFSISLAAADLNYVKDSDGRRPQPLVAITNVCAWPNLTLMPDGAIVAAIHNQPSHLKLPSDIECWASVDGGLSWNKRGMPAPRDTPKTARGNVAAGLAQNGDLIVIASGWSDPTAKKGRGAILRPYVSRSSDGGHTWTIDHQTFSKILVPFGDILPGADGQLRVALYRGQPGTTVVYRSPDDGKTWREPMNIDQKVVIHEPAIFHLGEGKWLAAARYDGLNLYTSEDDAKTWTLREKFSGRQQHPGHFTRLKDGRVLATYGNRLRPKGIDIRFSDDEAKTWSAAQRLADFEGDGGYPSSVQRPDGKVVTAYYARKTKVHNGYHMAVVIWEPASLR